jgi:predicted TIM-barrel fold metal-dependent hydrolase
MLLLSRRRFLATLGSAALARNAFADATSPADPIIDIHQHTNYSGRSDEELIAHQRKIGITHTILLPAGRYFGLDAQCGMNETVAALAKRLPAEFSFFANEVPYLTEAREEIEKYLRRGGVGIGEQKFTVESDSRAVQLLAEIAQEFGVPVLLHFQFGRYNTSYARFGKILEKFPKVNFIGHAQTFWANIDANCDQVTLYPKGPVTPGGTTDRYLRDYPNMFADLSAGSALNALRRDEAHAREFIARHENKLLFGTDCDDRVGEGEKCSGAQMLATLRAWAPSKAVERKILFENARRLLKLRG